MRALRKTMVTAAVLSLAAVQLQAAPGGAGSQQNAAPLVRLAQGGFYDDDYRAACPSGQHLSCWYEPYGYRFCGCWLGGDRPACPTDYHYACRYGPNGYKACGCY